MDNQNFNNQQQYTYDQQPVYNQPPVQQGAPDPYQPVEQYSQPTYVQPPVYNQPPFYSQTPVYNQPPTYAPPLGVDLNGLAKSALVMGILASSFICTFYFSFMSIIFGIIGISKANKFKAYNGGVSYGKAKIGSILSKVGLIVGIVFTALVVIVVSAIVFAALETNYHY